MKTLLSSPIILRVALLGVVLLAAPAAHAITYTVDTIEDLSDDNVADGLCHAIDGTCSLRAAIMQANHRSGTGSTIIDVPAGTYILTLEANGVADDGEGKGDLNLSTPPAIRQSIVIRGAGADSTIIDGNQLDRVMTVGARRVASISGVTIRNGNRQAISRGDGGGIANDGNLTITDCVIEDNRADGFGGGLSNSLSGVLNIVRGSIRFNGTPAAGGGVFNFGTLTITDSVIEGNSTDSYGGGIYSYTRGVLNVLRSTVRSNVALGYGGGMLISGATLVRDSVFYANSGGDGGGGIAHLGQTEGSHLYIVNSTLSDNSTPGNGGGIYSATSTSTGATFLYNTTIFHNKANSTLQSNGVGGGVYALPRSRFGLVNTLMARNTAGFDTNNDCSGSFEAYGRNFVGDPTAMACITSNAPLYGVTPSTIGPLQDNGGPTLTHALLPGSQAIDSALFSLGCVDETGIRLAYDQRGSPRPASTRFCDAGAFEADGVVQPIIRGIH